MAFRDGPLGDRKLPLTWTAAGATGAALLVALGLLLTDQRQSSGPAAYGAPRSQFDELMEPITGVLAAPVRWVGEGVDYLRGYFLAVEENRRLKREIAELNRYKDAAIALKSINDRYESLLKLRTEPPIPSVAARVIADARGPFSNARLADAGTERGVKIGDPVLSQHGVVGRVVGVTQGASRILMLTDVDARTPVTIDRSNARAILVGDGGPYPKLEYMRGQDPARAGDVLMTSGDGGVYPRGLPVGVVSKDLRGAWRAQLYADAAPIDYVRILSYRDFASSIDPASLNSKGEIPALTADEQKGLQAALAPPPAPKVAAVQSGPTSTVAPAPAKSAASLPPARPEGGAGQVHTEPAPQPTHPPVNPRIKSGEEGAKTGVAGRPAPVAVERPLHRSASTDRGGLGTEHPAPKPKTKAKTAKPAASRLPADEPAPPRPKPNRPPRPSDFDGLL